MDAILGVLGLLVSIAGFCLALWQLGRTRRAAEAAKEAANKAFEGISFIQAVSTIQDICGRSRDLLHLTRAKNISAAANAAFELRDALSRFSVTNKGLELQEAHAWNVLLLAMGSIQDRLESAAITRRLDSEERESLIHEISKSHACLSTLSGYATIFGASNADT